MKSDSAKVAHVDVRVALSKSLPQSSDKGAQLCETFPTAVELLVAVTSAEGLAKRRFMGTRAWRCRLPCHLSATKARTFSSTQTVLANVSQ